MHAGECIKKDTDMSQVLNFVCNGWPISRPQGNTDALKPYFNAPMVICEMNGVLVRDSRVIVPQELQSKGITMLHHSHRGIVRMKTMARLPAICLVATNIGTIINTCCKACNVCAVTASAPAANLSPWPLPDEPWDRIHVDFAGSCLRNMYGCWSWTPTQSGQAPFVCQIIRLRRPPLWRSTFSSPRRVVQRHLSQITGLSLVRSSLRTGVAWTASYTWHVPHFTRPLMARPNDWLGFQNDLVAFRGRERERERQGYHRLSSRLPQHGEMCHGTYSGWADDRTTSTNSALSSTAIRTSRQYSAAAFCCVRDRGPRFRYQK